MKKTVSAFLVLIFVFLALPLCAFAAGYKTGDVNGDGNVNSKDYALLKRYCLGTYNLNSSARSAGDINGDGAVNAKDYALLKRYCLGTYRISLPSVGDTITFGSYEQDLNYSNGKEKIEWIVLEVKNDKALVISKYVIDAHRYNETDKSVTWAASSVRTWLNGTFMNNAFTSSERSKIQTTYVGAGGNPEYNVYYGNATSDKLFFLSIDEAKKYFKNDDARICYATLYAMNNAGYVSLNGDYSWWLRSPGQKQTWAANVDSFGIVRNMGYPVTNLGCGVRPAMWISLK